MKKCKLVEFGTLNPNKNAVFLAIYLKNKCYKGYPHTSEDIQNTTFCQLLFVNRWDGSKGFVGGNIDEGEDLITALKREVLEEINFNITEQHTLKEICSHDCGNINTHLYSLEINLEEKHSILSHAHFGKDYEAEICGLLFQHIFRNKDNNIEKACFDRFLNKNFFAKSVKEEVEILIQKENLYLD